MTTSNGYATRDMLAGFTRLYADVELPNGQKVRIQSLNNREKEELQYALLGKDGKPNFRAALVGQQARLIAAAVVDGEGQRVFSEDDDDLIQTDMDPDIIDVLSSEIIEHTGINESSIERLKKRYADNRGSSLPTSSPNHSENAT